jgi:hypothetical protein
VEGSGHWRGVRGYEAECVRFVWALNGRGDWWGWLMRSLGACFCGI